MPEKNKIKSKIKIIHREEEEKRTEELAAKLGLPYLNLTTIPIDPSGLEIVPLDKAKEAEVIITESREKANSESQRIMTAGDLNLKDVQNKIDAKFNEAVDIVVSTVLKA